ncbi:hypothetical protein V6N13_137936 [Hibiscus sabdariffa]
MADVQGVDDKPCEESLPCTSRKQETRDEMLSRHKKEITELQNKEISLKKAAAKVKAIAGVSVTPQQDHPKPSKDAKRREKRAQQDAAREQRIQEEQSNIVSDRMIEDEKLERKLKPLGFIINEIKPDGHCLYRVVEDQLALLSGENTTDGDSDDSLAERFENYCKKVESTAAWGGQLELEALTHCLRKHIMIFSGSFPNMEMGNEYKSNGESSSSEGTLKLSYHKHAFGLGEHYNFVIPNLIR